MHSKLDRQSKGRSKYKHFAIGAAFGVSFLVLAVVVATIFLPTDQPLEDSMVNLFVGVFFSLVILCVVYQTVFVGVSDFHPDSRKERLRAIRESRRRRLRRNELAQLIAKEKAKLDTDDYSNRLENYLPCVSESKNTDRELPESKAEYWEAPELEIETHHPRPLGLIRVLLGRIYKALYVPGKSR